MDEESGGREIKLMLQKGKREMDDEKRRHERIRKDKDSREREKNDRQAGRRGAKEVEMQVAVCMTVCTDS